MIGCVVAENQRDWDVQLPYLMCAYRAARHKSTGFSPNFLMLGREIALPIDLVCGIPALEKVSYADQSEFVEERRDMLNRAFCIVRQHLKTSVDRNKKYYDSKVKPNKFNRGDWIYYYYPRKYAGRSPKWQKLYIGPMLVLKVLSPVTYLIQRSARAKPLVTHVDKLKACTGPVPKSWLAEKPSLVTGANLPVAENNNDVHPMLAYDEMIGNAIVCAANCLSKPESNLIVGPSLFVGRVRCSTGHRDSSIQDESAGSDSVSLAELDCTCSTLATFMPDLSLSVSVLPECCPDFCTVAHTAVYFCPLSVVQNNSEASHFRPELSTVAVLCSTKDDMPGQSGPRFSRTSGERPKTDYDITTADSSETNKLEATDHTYHTRKESLRISPLKRRESPKYRDRDPSHWKSSPRHREPSPRYRSHSPRRSPLRYSGASRHGEPTSCTYTGNWINSSPKDSYPRYDDRSSPKTMIRHERRPGSPVDRRDRRRKESPEKVTGRHRQCSPNKPLDKSTDSSSRRTSPQHPSSVNRDCHSPPPSSNRAEASLALTSNRCRHVSEGQPLLSLQRCDQLVGTSDKTDARRVTIKEPPEVSDADLSSSELCTPPPVLAVAKLSQQMNATAKQAGPAVSLLSCPPRSVAATSDSSSTAVTSTPAGPISTSTKASIQSALPASRATVSTTSPALASHMRQPELAIFIAATGKYHCQELGCKSQISRHTRVNDHLMAKHGYIRVKAPVNMKNYFDSVNYTFRGPAENLNLCTPPHSFVPARASSVKPPGRKVFPGPGLGKRIPFKPLCKPKRKVLMYAMLVNETESISGDDSDNYDNEDRTEPVKPSTPINKLDESITSSDLMYEGINVPSHQQTMAAGRTLAASSVDFGMGEPRNEPPLSNRTTWPFENAVPTDLLGCRNFQEFNSILTGCDTSQPQILPAGQIATSVPAMILDELVLSRVVDDAVSKAIQANRMLPVHVHIEGHASIRPVQANTMTQIGGVLCHSSISCQAVPEVASSVTETESVIMATAPEPASTAGHISLKWLSTYLPLAFERARRGVSVHSRKLLRALLRNPALDEEETRTAWEELSQLVEPLSPANVDPGEEMPRQLYLLLSP